MNTENETSSQVQYTSDGIEIITDKITVNTELDGQISQPQAALNQPSLMKYRN